MKTNISYGLVNGLRTRTIEQIDEETGFPVFIEDEFQTVHCGWSQLHPCSRACDIDCPNAQELFDEIGIEY